MGSESMRKAYLESTRKGVFGTTSTRTQPIMRREDLELPGPAHYQPKEKPFKPRYVQPTANFSSVTNRLVEPPNTVKVSSLEILLGGSGRVLCPAGWLVAGLWVKSAGWFLGGFFFFFCFYQQTLGAACRYHSKLLDVHFVWDEE